MNLEKNDIQGLLIRGYGHLPAATFFNLQIENAEKAKAYIEKIIGQISRADHKPDDYAMHLAFTYEGLKALELPGEVLQTFSREFKEGMTEPHRQFVLGDVAHNAPENWSWGNPVQPKVHLLFLLYAKDKTILEEACAREKKDWLQYQLTILNQLETNQLPEHKEHFGFRDGISQPLVEALVPEELKTSKNTVPTGEFILGYPNWYQQLPETPEVDPSLDPKDILPQKEGQPTVRDLGRNGSYLVVRQLSQDVVAFWKFMQEKSFEPSGCPFTKAIKLAAKMVGRWPNGTALVKSPEEERPELATANDFGYWDEDPHGIKCPFGAHIRRTNPRDWLLTEKTKTDSQEMVDKHRILRRGRSYGTPLTPSMNPEDLMNAAPDGEKRGLFFMAFVGDIVRQFEFIQNAWVRFHKFGGLYSESDPILGPHYESEAITTSEFTVPAKPVRRRYKALPAFTQMQGGAYFFFPGIRALEFLAKFDAESCKAQTVKKNEKLETLKILKS